MALIVRKGDYLKYELKRPDFDNISVNSITPPDDAPEDDVVIVDVEVLQTDGYSSLIIFYNPYTGQKNNRAISNSRLK